MQMTWSSEFGNYRNMEITNPITQKVCITLSGAAERHFLNDGCSSNEKIKNIHFKIKSGRTAIKGNDGRDGRWLTATEGNESFCHNHLPEGKYTIEMYSREYTSSEKTQFAMQTFATEQKVNIPRANEDNILF